MSSFKRMFLTDPIVMHAFCPESLSILKITIHLHSLFTSKYFIRSLYTKLIFASRSAQLKFFILIYKLCYILLLFRIKGFVWTLTFFQHYIFGLIECHFFNTFLFSLHCSLVFFQLKCLILQHVIHFTNIFIGHRRLFYSLLMWGMVYMLIRLK